MKWQKLESLLELKWWTLNNPIKLQLGLEGRAAVGRVSREVYKGIRTASQDTQRPVTVGTAGFSWHKGTCPKCSELVSNCLLLGLALWFRVLQTKKGQIILISIPSDEHTEETWFTSQWRLPSLQMAFYDRLLGSVWLLFWDEGFLVVQAVVEMSL